MSAIFLHIFLYVYIYLVYALLSYNIELYVECNTGLRFVFEGYYAASTWEIDSFLLDRRKSGITRGR